MSSKNKKIKYTIQPIYFLPHFNLVLFNIVNYHLVKLLNVEQKKIIIKEDTILHIAMMIDQERLVCARKRKLKQTTRKGEESWK